MTDSVYLKRDMCTGCSACSAVCPKECIQMKSDEKGFLYPEIDKAKCVDCEMCKKVCHTYQIEERVDMPPLYGYTNSNEKVLNESSSGGAFSAVAEKVVASGGYVCGAVFDDNLTVRHIVTNEQKMVQKMRSSKYVQSQMGNCYKQIMILLKAGKDVIFTGTPCQVLGLKSFLMKDYSNLYTLDCICHSVPSPLVFSKYIEELEKKDGKIIEFSFRCKKNGWKDYGLFYRTQNTEKIMPHKGNFYMEGFLDGLYHRESCNQCPVKTRVNYKSDLTIGDFWGVNNIAPEIYNPNGVSAILINTEKGKALVESLPLTLCDNAMFTKVNNKYQECAVNGQQMELFWNMIKEKNLINIYQVIYRIPLSIKIKTKIKRAIRGE